MSRQTLGQRGIVGLRRGGHALDDHIQPIERVLVPAKRLPDDAFDSIAPAGQPTGLFRDGQPEPGTGTVVRTIQNGKECVAASFRFLEYAAERRSVQQSMDSAEAMSAFVASPAIVELFRARKRGRRVVTLWG